MSFHSMARLIIFELLIFAESMLILVAHSVGFDLVQPNSPLYVAKTLFPSSLTPVTSIIFSLMSAFTD